MDGQVGALVRSGGVMKISLSLLVLFKYARS